MLAVLGAANLAAFFLLMQPVGGSAEDLDRELASLRAQGQRQQAQVARLRALAAKVEKAQGEQGSFLKTYFMDRRTASSTILTEIGDSAKKAGLKPRDHAFLIEPIEGSDTLSMMTINANYEGSYADLVEFVNAVDRSRRLLIIDSIAAAPQQAPGMLSARFKINTFIREEGKP